MDPFWERYKFHIVIFAVAIAVTFILYGNTLVNGFTLDDHPVVENRSTLRSLTNIPHFFVEPWHPNGQWGGNYRPMTLITFALNWAISSKPWGFHLINILLHAFNCSLIFFFVRRFASVRVAWITAFLFLIIPIHSEAVASIAARNGLLAFTFIILAAINAWDGRHWRGTLFFLLAIFSSDSAIGFFPLAGILLAIRHKWNLRTAFGLWWRYIIPIVVYFPIRYLALGKYTFHGEGYVNEIIGPLAFLSLPERVLNGLVHLSLYVQKTFIPTTLSPDYSYNQIPIIYSLWTSLPALIGVMICIIAVALFIYGSSSVKMAVSWFFIPFVLISNTIVVTTGTMAERWWYLPSFGILLLCALGIDALLDRLPHVRSLLIIGGIILVIWWGVILVRQNTIWRNDRTLAIAAAEKSPQSTWAHSILAEQFLGEKNDNAAQEEVVAALAITDKNPLAWFVKGKLHWKVREYKKAEQSFLHALEVDYHRRNARSLYRSLALLSFDQGDNKQALMYMEQAVQHPIAGDTKTVTAVDTYLLNLFAEYEHKNPILYSSEEIEQFGNMIHAIMGF